MKLNLTNEQKEKLRAGYRRALEIPETFDMMLYIDEDASAPCGTVVCYAGELAITLGRFKPLTLLRKHYAGTNFCIPTYAEELVGLPSGSLDNSIFQIEFWPKHLFRQYTKAATPMQKAEALRDAVEDFIAKDGDW